MPDFHQFADPFLAALSAKKKVAIESRREAWRMSREDFYPRIEGWFANFNDRDKKLALKILLRIQYFCPEDFDRRIRELCMSVTRFLHHTNSSISDLILVVPDERGDSADRHAYDIIKRLFLEQIQIVAISDISAERHSDRILVFFNDTHGTGNQILRELFARLAPDKFKAIFVVAVTIAKKALRRFELELTDVQVVPSQPSQSVMEQFTAEEYRRIRELGAEVYNNHPVGYGEAGLLTAYYFQCPNNTIPIIWADGSNNRTDSGCFPWAPLFPYRPKRPGAAQVTSRRPIPEAPEPSMLDSVCAWSWSEEERSKIVNQIKTWGLSSQKFYERTSSWFGNFSVSERELSLKVFLATRYFGIDRIRQGIRHLRAQVILNIRKAGGDISDVLLVMTGDKQNSVYHYAFEFVREWGLDTSQVCDISRLTPDKVIDKTLVFFYHTRASGHHFFQSQEDGRSYANRLISLTPRAIFVAAYAMTDAAVKTVQKEFVRRPNFHCIRLEEASVSVAQLLPDDLAQLASIRAEILTNSTARDPTEELMTAYYFQCPLSSSPLIWSEHSAMNPRRWVPLFRNIQIPA